MRAGCGGAVGGGVGGGEELGLLQKILGWMSRYWTVDWRYCCAASYANGRGGHRHLQEGGVGGGERGVVGGRSFLSDTHGAL